MPTKEIVFEHAPISLFYKDLKNNIVQVNNAFLAVSGFTREEIEGKSLFDVFPRGIAEKYLEDDLEVANTRCPKTGIIEFAPMPSGLVWFRTDKVPHIVDGEVVGVIGFLLDITNEKLLQEQSVQQAQLFDMLFDPCTLINEKGGIEDANQAAVDLLGYTKEELVEMDLNQLIVPDDRHLFQEFLMTENTDIFPLVFRGLKKGGIEYLGEVSTTKFFKIGNKRISASLVRDLTDRNAMTDKILNQSKAIEYSPSTLVITDIEGNITYVNPKFSEVTGYHYKEVLGKNPRILKSGKMPKQQYKKMWDTISSGGIWRGEFLNKTKDGTFYWEIASIAPVKEKCGKIISYVKVAEIVTDLKQTIVNLWNILDYSNYFIAVIDGEREVRLCNRMLAKTLGFETEEELIGKNWFEFVPEAAKEVAQLVQDETIEKKLGTVESTSEIVTLGGKVIIVKWFNSFINSELDWVFSMGVPLQADEQETFDNVREFYREVLAKDRTTIDAIKKRIKHEETG